MLFHDLILSLVLAVKAVVVIVFKEHAKRI